MNFQIGNNQPIDDGEDNRNWQQQWQWKKYGAASTKVAAARVVVATLVQTWRQQWPTKK